MSRSLLVYVALAMLGLGALGFEQGMSAEAPIEMLSEADERSQQGDIDGAIELLQQLRSHELTKVGRWYLESRLLRLIETQKSRQARSPQRPKREMRASHRYQLLGESGWIYRLDTMTGEVLGVQVGGDQWQRIHGAPMHESPVTDLSNE